MSSYNYLYCYFFFAIERKPFKSFSRITHFLPFFQDSVANLYNNSPASISSVTDYHHFVKESAKILKAKAIMQLA